MSRTFFFRLFFLFVHFINTRFEYCFRKITETIISCIRLYVHSVCGVRYFRWLVQVFASNFLLHITHWFFFVGSSRANVIRNTYGGGVSGQSEVNWQVYFTIFFFERISLQPAALRGTRGGTWIAVIIVKLIKLSATQQFERAWSHLQRRLDGVLQRVQVAWRCHLNTLAQMSTNRLRGGRKGWFMFCLVSHDSHWLLCGTLRYDPLNLWLFGEACSTRGIIIN